MISMKAPPVKRFETWFLRRFSTFRIMEYEYERVFNLNKKHADEKAALRKKVVSDSNLIESLNRHIGALEGKAAMQVELIQELKEKLNTLLAIPNNRKTTQ